jgi:hypothetical protein
VSIRPVDGGSGPFNTASAAAGEASLDTQMSLGTAPGAREILYDMPDLTNAEIIDAYTAVDEDNIVDVVSSSFGECELDFTAAYNGGTDFTALLTTLHSLSGRATLRVSPSSRARVTRAPCRVYRRHLPTIRQTGRPS